MEEAQVLALLEQPEEQEVVRREQADNFERILFC
jgi:hypothetical protein